MYSRFAFAGAITALVAHHLEWRQRDPQLASTLLFAALAHSIVLVQAYVERVRSIATVARLVIVADASFAVALLGSMALYRFWFHPLRLVPGPKMARLSMLYRFWYYSRGQHAHKLDEWHRMYGDFVRYGPNCVSIIDPRCIEAVHRLDKGNFYAAKVSEESALSKVRSAAEHRPKRQLFVSAFTPAALTSYRVSLAQRCQELVDLLGAQGEIDLYDWVSRLLFDLTSDISFSGHSHLMAKGDVASILPSVRYAVQRSGRIGSLHWIDRPVKTLCRWLPPNLLPIWLATNAAFYAFAKSCLAARLSTSPMVKDVFSYLIEHAGKLTPKQLGNAAALMIGAGVDTSSSALAVINVLLLQHPGVLVRLREELDALYPRSTHGDLDDRALATSAPFLNAVVNEALRLHPVLQSGSERVVGHKGLVLPNGIVLPPGTTVVMPHLALHRREASFERPDDFLPERWLSDSGIRSDPTAWLAFSAGRAGCLGRDLALSILRMATASIVLRLDFSLPAEFDADAWRASIADYYAPELQPLPVLVKARTY